MTELGKRIISASILAVALLITLWLGGPWYAALLIVGGGLVLREWWRLTLAMTPALSTRAVWIGSGAVYIALALYSLWRVRTAEDGFLMAAWLFFAVWGTDVGAYIFGQTFGGPKIAPAISPSKTWAGVIGAALCATIVMLAFERITGARGRDDEPGMSLATAFALGTAIAVIAQAGDFFESWMKRRAGVKDSGAMIPGHGGLFDRIDGLLPVAIVFPWLLGVAR